MRAGVRAACFLALTASVVPARADTAEEKRACLQTVEGGQLARSEGHLRRARDAFVTCSRASCPSAIRDDCIRWVNEVEASLPTVAFSAQWPDGRDVTRMSVKVDGQLLAGAETGRALAVDPGEHTFRFEAEGALAVEQHDVIREGEKNRMLRVTFEAASGSVSAPAATRSLARSPSSASRPDPVPVSVYVLGGVALASFGTFAYLGLKGTGDLASLRSSSCGEAGTCSASAVGTARSELLAGDIIGLAGVAAVGVATWLFFTRHQGRAPPPLSAAWFAPSAGQGTPCAAFTWK